METQITIQDEALRRAISRASDAAYEPLFRAARRSVARYRQQFLAGRFSRGVKLRGGKEGLKRRFLWRSKPRNETSGRIEDIEVSFYTDSIVAYVHEFGAIVRPRGRRALAIPVGYALTKTGRPKRAWKSPRRARARGYKLHYIPPRNGHGALLAVDRSDLRGRNGSPNPETLEVAYVLTPRVTFEAQLGFYDGWDKFLRAGEVDKRFRQEFGKYLREHFGQRGAA